MPGPVVSAVRGQSPIAGAADCTRRKWRSGLCAILLKHGRDRTLSRQCRSMRDSGDEPLIETDFDGFHRMRGGSVMGTKPVPATFREMHEWKMICIRAHLRPSVVPSFGRGANDRASRMTTAGKPSSSTMAASSRHSMKGCFARVARSEDHGRAARAPLVLRVGGPPMPPFGREKKWARRPRSLKKRCAPFNIQNPTLNIPTRAAALLPT